MNMGPRAIANIKRVRCAIYTRKSTEDGLEQEFNSLDAQRESAEAFVKSQAPEGWSTDEIHVYAEPGSEAVGNCIWHQNAEKLGCYRNWVNSVRQILASTDANIIMTVQDDARFHPDSKSFTESKLWSAENTGFVSLYTPAHYSHGRPTGVNRIHTRNLWGCLALVWKREVLQQVVEHPLMQTWLGLPSKENREAWLDKRRNNKSLINNIDHVIGKVLNKLKRPMYFVDPSPVDHVSPVSTLNHGGNKGRRNCGRCADHAKSLAEQVAAGTIIRFDAYEKHRDVQEAFEKCRTRLANRGFDLSFSLPYEHWLEIAKVVKPGMVTLEFGSGLSTSAFGAAAQHIALEHSRWHASLFRSALYTPLKDGWYESVPNGPFDLVLLDGPGNIKTSKCLWDCIGRVTRPGAVLFVTVSAFSTIQAANELSSALEGYCEFRRLQSTKDGLWKFRKAERLFIET